MKKAVVMTAALAALSVLLSGCGKKEDSKKAKSYTYRTVLATPKTWSPTDWQMNEENYILTFTSSPLYDYIPNENQDGYEVVPDMAVALPEDVTAEYAGNEKYGVPADATEGWAWKIQIRKDMKWDNGEAINVDDFI